VACFRIFSRSSLGRNGCSKEETPEYGLSKLRAFAIYPSLSIKNSEIILEYVIAVYKLITD
jgi:hypothetical protein